MSYVFCVCKMRSCKRKIRTFSVTFNKTIAKRIAFRFKTVKKEIIESAVFWLARSQQIALIWCIFKNTYSFLCTHLEQNCHVNLTKLPNKRLFKLFFRI